MNAANKERPERILEQAAAGIPTGTRKNPHKRRCIVVLLASFAALAMPARAEDRQREFVPEMNAYFKLSDRTRLYLLGNVTRNLTEDTSEGEAGAHLDFTLMPLLRPQMREADWHRDRYLWMRAGYVLLGGPDSPTERRAILEATARVPLPGEVWLVNRARVDLRDVDGEHSQRYRLRLGIEREFTTDAGLVLVPYGQAETFYDTRFDTWNRQLYQAGVEIELTKNWRLEPYVARQNDSRSASGNVDRVGLVVKYYR